MLLRGAGRLQNAGWVLRAVYLLKVTLLVIILPILAGLTRARDCTPLQVGCASQRVAVVFANTVTVVPVPLKV